MRSPVLRPIPATVCGGPFDGLVLTISLGQDCVIFPFADEDGRIGGVRCGVRWERDEAVVDWPEDA